jgi:carbonic anhydrase
VIDIVYRFVPGYQSERPAPTSPDDARARLEAGNRAFAEVLAQDAPDSTQSRIVMFDLAELGASGDGWAAPKQAPFAIVLGCSDARVPTELVFSQGCNDLFVVRVAGNVLGNECLGSIDYAVSHLHPSLRLLVVLGHSGCGAVAACVDAYLTPAHYLDLATSHSLRSIIDRISIGVRAASRALETAFGAGVVSRPGYRQALMDATVVVHAMLTAHTLEREFGGRSGCQVAFGIYDLVTRRVGLPSGVLGVDETLLLAPPEDKSGFAELMARITSSERMRRTLDGAN